MGPFSKVARNKRYLLVGTYYFTKGVEAEPLAKSKDVDAKKFVWKILSLGLESLVPSSQKMVCSLIVKPSEVLL